MWGGEDSWQSMGSGASIPIHQERRVAGGREQGVVKSNCGVMDGTRARSQGGAEGLFLKREALQSRSGHSSPGNAPLASYSPWLLPLPRGPFVPMNDTSTASIIITPIPLLGPPNLCNS